MHAFVIIIIEPKQKQQNLAMNQLCDQEISRSKQFANDCSKIEVASIENFGCLSGKKQTFYFSDSSTKASSILQNANHESSFEFSEASFQNQTNKADDFLSEELLFQRVVGQNQMALSEQYFEKQFISRLKGQLCVFIQHPSNSSFRRFLQLIIIPKTRIFSSQQSEIVKGTKLYSLRQAMQMLIVQRKNQFFIHTFSLVVCPLAFFVILMTYWIQPQTTFSEIFEEPYIQNSKPDDCISLRSKVKQNITWIVRSYVQAHSQQISQNQILFIVILYFIDELKLYKQCEASSLTQLQRNLAKYVRIYRSIQNLDRKILKPSSKQFELKLSKFEQSLPFVKDTDVIYKMIKSHTIHNLASTSLEKIYQSGEFREHRKQYQKKKDGFCFWALKCVLDSQQKSSTITPLASLHIIKFMEVLKKFRNENNMEAVSYIVPVLANLKALLPKAWRHVASRRPQIDKKFDEYARLMLQHLFKVTQLKEDGIAWAQTNFIMAQKIVRHVGGSTFVDLEGHKKYFEDFLLHFLYFRQKSKGQLNEPKYQLALENLGEIGFDIRSIQIFLSQKFEEWNSAERWNNLIEQSKKINENISQSLISDILDYCFVGSAQIYQLADI